MHIESKSRANTLFLSSLRTEATKKTYTHALDGFKRFVKLTSIEDILTMDAKVLENKIIDFVIDGKNNKMLSHVTNNVKIAALQKFCEINDVTTINWKKIRSFLGTPQRTVKDRIYTKEEIRKLLEICDDRKRLLILIFLSTGMRLGALVELKLKHIKKSEKEGVYQFTVYENTKEEYITFCTPECTQAIDSYLRYRERAGEVLTAESPLIREQFNAEDLEDVKSAKPLATGTIQRIMLHLLKVSGIRKKSNNKKRKEIMAIHGFRKYFNTMMIKAGVHLVVKEMLLGHSVKLDDSYYRPTEEELLKEYLKAVDLLTISEEKQLKEEVTKLKTEVADIDIMKKSYLDMKLELEKRNHQVDELYKVLYAKGIIKKE